MREYKFRGKTKNHFGDDKGNVVVPKGTWIYGGITYDADRVWIDTKYYGQIIVDKETIGQFTGLHDKNGKEIYEGDRVYIVPEDEYGEVKWDNETARFVVIYNDIWTDFDNWYGYDLEVVGTIYDS